MPSVAPHNEYLTRRTRPDIYQGLFSEQRAACEDMAALVDWVCSRRAGKTHGLVHKAAKTCEKPKALIGYLTKTREWARDLVWLPFKDICIERRMASDKEFNNSRLRAEMFNGSVVKLAGAKDISQVEVLRGFGYDLFIIDEAGSIDPVVMRYVVKEILPTALGEKNGQLIVSGTPPPSCAGYFHDIATDRNSKFSHHHWTQRQNVMFPLWKGCPEVDGFRDWLVDGYLQSERDKHKLSETDPEYLREYMGLWAKNQELFIYRITEDNLQAPPDVPMRFVLALDIGWHDMTAWELVGYDQHEQCMYEIESHSEQHLTFDKIAERTIQYATDYELDRVVVDTAGAGKVVQDSLARELSARFRVPCEAAQKNRKGTNMKFLASDFRAGKAFLLPNGVCQDQLKGLQWNEHRLIEKEPQPGQFIDNADAYLYAYRECYHWLHEPREEIPEVGTMERANWEMLQIEEEEAQTMENKQKRSWWER